MALDGANLWLIIGAAADAVGLPRRTAFRWAKLGLITVRDINGRRCVEVGALRRLAEARQGATQPAQIRATPTNTDETGTTPLPGLEQEALLALSESLTNIEELLAGLVLRLAGIERALGLR